MMTINPDSYPEGEIIEDEAMRADGCDVAVKSRSLTTCWFFSDYVARFGRTLVSLESKDGSSNFFRKYKGFSNGNECVTYERSFDGDFDLIEKKGCNGTLSAADVKWPNAVEYTTIGYDVADGVNPFAVSYRYSDDLILMMGPVARADELTLFLDDVECSFQTIPCAVGRDDDLRNCGSFAIIPAAGITLEGKSVRVMFGTSECPETTEYSYFNFLKENGAGQLTHFKKISQIQAIFGNTQSLVIPSVGGKIFSYNGLMLGLGV